MKDTLTEDLESVQLGEVVDSKGEEISEVRKIVEEIGDLLERNESPMEDDGVTNVRDDDAELCDNEKTKPEVRGTAFTSKCSAWLIITYF